MPKLEILSRLPSGPARSTPLLFVHGAFCGAWIWDEKFLGWFADRGWAAHAVSLRGHGGSDGHEALPWHGLGDYVNDVVQACERLGTMPVLIGHSMGGTVVQQALRRRTAPAAVLMASAPPHGLLESTIGLAFRDPWVFQQLTLLCSFGPDLVDPEGIRRAMFSDRMPRSEIVRYEPKLQLESRRVLLETMHWNPFPPVPMRGTPFQVLGAERDLLVPPDQVRSTARLMRTEAQFFPGMGHTMMLEPDWERVAEAVDGWLRKTLLAEAA